MVSRYDSLIREFLLDKMFSSTSLAVRFTASADGAIL